MILPHSNAHTERLFSSMNHIKSKTRNRMELQLLCSLLTIKFGLMRHGKCCNNYELPGKVTSAIGTLAAYSKPKEQTSTDTADEHMESIFDDNEPSTSWGLH